MAKEVDEKQEARGRLQIMNEEGWRVVCWRVETNDIITVISKKSNAIEILKDFEGQRKDIDSWVADFQGFRHQIQL